MREKCWICGRNSEEINEELGLKLNANDILVKPDFIELDKEDIKWGQFRGGPRRETISQELIDEHFSDIRLCMVCVSLIKCGTLGFFKK